jgi:NADP-dependent 3-hydroxy acid dehydrogenase YdfG
MAQICEVSDHSQVEVLAAATKAKLDGCDLFFANAGVISPGRLVNASVAEADRILGVNIRGAGVRL